MATLSLNEIRTRAIQFSSEFADESRERAEKDTFWNSFFEIFGLNRRRVAVFEKYVEKFNGKSGFIDLFWPGTLLVEHKSAGKDLDKAFNQAIDYFSGINEADLPKYILVSDFSSFKLYDLDDKIEYEFKIDNLVDNIHLFNFISGYTISKYEEESPVHTKVAQLLGKLHDDLKSSGYIGKDLELLLVRLVFCFFADDTGIFEKGSYHDFLLNRTTEDGTDLGPRLIQSFQVLNTPSNQRQKGIDEMLANLPYVNGDLFSDMIQIPSFSASMREVIITSSGKDWSGVSPAIFGSMFQAAMDPKLRKQLGAHYTSENNINKVLEEVLLKDLRKEFDQNKSSQPKLEEFHGKISRIKILDPACGSGNFLIVAYEKLRELELDILRETIFVKRKLRREVLASSGINVELLAKINISQFYGIEIDEFAVKIAEVAMYLIDHKMNMILSKEFGNYYARIPIENRANITNANSLKLDWNSLLDSNERFDYIFGNPPFYGKHKQTKEQKEDIASVFPRRRGISDLDYVSGWFYKAAQYCQHSTTRVALVSTNSITQGEQVPILWGNLQNDYPVEIFFAHKTFQWKNKAKKVAAVHCVIIGFTSDYDGDKFIYQYDNPKADPVPFKVKNISPYLIDAPNIYVDKSTKPLSGQPKMVYGNKPTDDGNFLFDKEELHEFIQKQPQADKLIRKYIGSTEFINRTPRFCLWLDRISPTQYKDLPLVVERIKAVRKFRLKSSAKPTQNSANYPQSFFYVSFTGDPYLVIPETSSARREYIPIGYAQPDTIASNALYTVPNADLYIFGIVTSKMHMIWVDRIGGKLKSDYRYTGSLLYNTFPFPVNPSNKNRQNVEKYSQQIMDIREKYFDLSYADLYDPILMPADLRKAHLKLDRSVEKCFRPQPFVSDNARINYLLREYDERLNPLMRVDRINAKKRKT